MNQSSKKTLGFIITTTFLIVACVLGQPAGNSEQFANLVTTSVAQTLTAFPTNMPTPTNTLSPTSTETIPPIQFTALPTFVLPTSTPAGTAKTDYMCDIINQRPFDDTEFRPGDSIDIKWTIVNTGTQKWEDGTYLEYQSGPQMTEETQVKLPRLKVGKQYDVVLDATVPSESGTQIMVWTVVGPGTIKDSTYWMCYPYIRIKVK